MGLTDIFNELVFTAALFFAVVIFSLFESPIKKAIAWIFKEAGLLIFGLIWLWLSYLLLTYTIADPELFRYKFSPFCADMFEYGIIIVFVGLFDFIVLWDHDTWNLICIERNESYAKVLGSLIIAGAILTVGTTL